ncbi:selenoprotein N-like isoform X2 [Octopus vulgaris]|uniref:Selenoprotein N-like isoform X2 n=1 Tax=Octopus vulgaris TaxID=6645 RepID=A0AA36B088_OCTVU|nr:selenoprotein N-like isoform X2 [Octopus vulgaris]
MASTTGPSGSVVSRSPAKSGNKTIPPSPKYSESRNRQTNKSSPKKSKEAASSSHRNSDNFSRNVNTNSSSNRNDVTKEQRMQNKKGKKTGDSKIKMKFFNCMKCMKSWLFWLSIIVAVVAILYKKSIEKLNYENAKQELLGSVGEAGLTLFDQYDFDEDGYLSLNEFIPITHRLIDVRVPIEYNFQFDVDDEALVVEASFVPLTPSTMKKIIEEGEQIMETQKCFSGLKEWKKPAKNLMIYSAKHFKPFLPTNPDFMNSVGKVYTLWEGSRFQYITGQMPSSNRYFPSLFKDNQAIFHSLLSMFHPRPFLLSRFEPQGAVACVRAYNSEFVDIAFRIHAEFQLNERPNLPFWFTPAYFFGNLIINKNATSLLKFNLAVPTHNKLNVDMEWLTNVADEVNMEVNIGFLPKMELKSLSRSTVHANQLDFEGIDEAVTNQEISSISWTEEISMEEAMKSMEVKMFPFKEVPYYNFTSAFKKAQAVQKLVHSIILWGVLDDQSC